MDRNRHFHSFDKVLLQNSRVVWRQTMFLVFFLIKFGSGMRVLIGTLFLKVYFSSEK